MRIHSLSNRTTLSLIGMVERMVDDEWEVTVVDIVQKKCEGREELGSIKKWCDSGS